MTRIVDIIITIVDATSMIADATIEFVDVIVVNSEFIFLVNVPKGYVHRILVDYVYFFGEQRRWNG